VFAGRIERIGERVDRASGWQVGDHVTAPFVQACGRCRQCRAGAHQVCPQQTQPGFSEWGSFAEYVVVRRADVNLVALPDGLAAVDAAALGCRYATGYRAVLEVGRASLGEWVVVHGCGGVGLSAVAVARAVGARVVAVDVDPEALRLARSVGAEQVLQVDPADDALEIGARVRRSTDGGAQVGLDALGSAATCTASIASLAPRGRHVQVGLLPAVLGWPQVPMHLVISGELELLGSHGLSPRSYPRLLELVVAGVLRPADLVTRTIGWDEAGQALADLGTPGAGVAGVTVVVP
jgi:alcohol dehydrogenase